jgi:PhnB protein
MPTRISPMLAVNDPKAAIAFYERAFGATIRWHLDHALAGLSIGGAEFFLAHESPQYGTRSPSFAGFTTVRIELFVDDPVAVHRQAVAAGATSHSPVNQHEHVTEGLHPIRRMLQGAVLDPFGHLWLIGKFLD